MSIITLTTDFGSTGSYVAQMKAVILSINPAAVLVDMTHQIPPQDVRQAALVLADATPLFPPETIHVVVVDPGVGTRRKILYARFGSQQYVAADNGCLTGLAARGAASTMVSLEDRRYHRPEVSATFHGRDIMAPVAAWLSLGVRAAVLGPAVSEMVRIPWPEARILPNKIEGEVVAVDSFGNLVTNITREMLQRIPAPAEAVIRCDEHETQGIYNAYGDQPPMTFIALVGSNGRLELAIVDDSAKMMLGVKEGEKVTVTW